MKTLKYLLVTLVIIMGTAMGSSVQAGIFDDIIDKSTPKVQICDDPEECGYKQGIELAKDAINDIETERSFSEYIQDIVSYALTFITIIAVVYIIYAGFRLMVTPGDDERMKKTKDIILYVIIGIVIIWLAWPITLWVLNLLGTSG